MLRKRDRLILKAAFLAGSVLIVLACLAGRVCGRLTGLFWKWRLDHAQ